MLNRIIAKIKADIGLFIILLGLISLLIFPWLLTRSWGLFHFNDSTGVIGDTIGGITGPISGFLGAVLVYLALKEQIKANRIITDQFERQQAEEQSKKLISIVTDQLKTLREDIKDFVIEPFSFFSIGDYNDGKRYMGAEAIMLVFDTFPTHHMPVESAIHKSYHSNVNEIKYFLGNIDYLLSQAINSRIPLEDKLYLLRIIQEVYKTKLQKGLTANILRKSSIQLECSICKGRHGIPDIIFDVDDSITQHLMIYDLLNHR